MAQANQERIFARLVGDDRVIVQVQHGRLIAQPHPSLAGLLEIRGIGLITCDFEPSCMIKTVIICQKEHPSRMPDPAEHTVTIGGVSLPCLFWRPGEGIEHLLLCLKSNYLAHIMGE